MVDNNRRSFLASVGAAIVGATSAAGSASAAKDYDYLDEVFTTSSLSVRTGPSTGNSRKAVMDKRTGGRIFEGPEAGPNGYNWWKVQFSGDSNNGPMTGWVAEDWLSSANFACPMTGTVTGTYWDCRPLGSCYRNHRAVDIANGGGTPIVAAAGGRADRRYDEGGYGNWLVLHHGNGWKTGYGHLRSFAVSDGESVDPGQVVAYEGATGAGSGPHLDFQVWDPDWSKRRSFYDKGAETIAGTAVPRVFY